MNNEQTDMILYLHKICAELERINTQGYTDERDYEFVRRSMNYWTEMTKQLNNLKSLRLGYVQ